MGKNKREIEYNGAQMATVIWLPKNAVKAKIKVECSDGLKAEMKLDRNGIIECRNNYLSIDPNDVAFAIFKLDPEYKKFLEAGGRHDDWDDYKREQGI